MKTKYKIWAGLGIIILIWNIYWFVKVRIFNDYGIVGNVIKLTLGYYLLAAFILITIGYLIIKMREK